MVHSISLFSMESYNMKSYQSSRSSHMYFLSFRKSQTTYELEAAIQIDGMQIRFTKFPSAQIYFLEKKMHICWRKNMLGVLCVSMTKVTLVIFQYLSFGSHENLTSGGCVERWVCLLYHYTIQVNETSNRHI